MPSLRPPHCLPSSPPKQALLTAAVLAALAVSAPAQVQFGELPRKSLPVDADASQAIALGDVDGDGDLDMVVGNSGQNRLYLNDGTGTFSDATASQMPVDSDYATSVALGDVDGDGDLDMVLGNSGQPGLPGQQNRLYLNDGTGTFSDATASQMPLDSDGTTAVALGDVDGDGDLDMVFGNWSQQDRLYLNNGTGTFSDVTATQLPAGQVASAVSLGDVDGDGDLDLVIGNNGQNRLYLNDGTGTFSDVTATQLPAGGASAVALGDVDGDGDLDMVVGNSGQNRLYLNDGTGTFSDATASQMPVGSQMISSVVLGDLDGDGDLDMVLCGSTNSFSWYCSCWWSNMQLLLNDGAGTFAHAGARGPLVWGQQLHEAVVLGDVDDDGDLDLIQANTTYYSYSPQNRLYLNLQRQLHAPVAPQLGQPYTLDAYLRYGPASTVDLAAIYLSTAPASIPLGSLGTLGIDPAMAAPFPTLIIPQPAGVGSVGFTVPNVPGLIGQEIFSQAMLIAYPNDLRLSNVVRDVIQ